MTWHCEHSTPFMESAIFSLDDYLAGIPLAPARSSSPCESKSLPDSATESCPDTRSGTISVRSAEHLGADVSTFSPVAFLARIFLLQVKGLAPSLGVDQYCGPKCSESLAKWHARSCSWRTTQTCFIRGLTTYLEPWPKWGTIVDGELSQLPMPALRMNGGDCGSLPTPIADDAKGGDVYGGGNMKLTGAVKKIPTPTARDWRSGKGAKDRERHAQQLPEVAKGQLNPTWVEWVMGWPIGATDLGPGPSSEAFRDWLMDSRDAVNASMPLGMDGARRLPRWPGKYSQRGY